MTRTHSLKHTSFFIALIGIFWIACGENKASLMGPETQDDSTVASKVAMATPAQTKINVQVTNTDGSPLPNLNLELFSTVSGMASLVIQTVTTNALGQAQLSFESLNIPVGYYTIRATDLTTKAVIDQWHSLPLDRGEIFVSLPVGKRAKVHSRGPKVTVMTRNLYWGADINRVLAPDDPSVPLPVLVAQAWQMAQQNNFVERAQAIANEIAEARPHLIGLQECTQFRIQSPGDVLQGNPIPATDMALDFLAVLLSELDGRNLSYRAVAVSQGADFELPMYTGNNTPLADIRLTNLDVILARNGVQIDNAITQQYEAKVPISIGGVPTSIPRSWASVEATIAGRTIRFFTTHLETSGAEPIQRLQAGELYQHIAATEMPVVVVGDFNSDVYGSTTATYAEFVDAGMQDVYQTLYPNRIAYTASLGDEDLLLPDRLNRRIDHIFVRQSDGLMPVYANIVGESEKDRTPSGLWPSDHAGMIAKISLPTQKPF